MKKEENYKTVNVKLEETRLPQMMKDAFVSNSYNMDEEDCKALLNISVYSIVKFLGQYKEKRDKKVALRVIDAINKGSFIVGFIVEYIPGDNEDDPGSWALSATFNEDELKDCKVYESTDKSFTIFMAQVANNIFNIMIHTEVGCQIILQTIFTSLIKYAKENAKADEETVIEIPECIMFSYKLNKELVDMAIEFDHIIKMLVKDDAVLAK